MAEQANDPLIGQAFHGYRIERKLAEGGMGAVYQIEGEHRRQYAFRGRPCACRARSREFSRGGAELGGELAGNRDLELVGGGAELGDELADARGPELDIGVGAELARRDEVTRSGGDELARELGWGQHVTVQVGGGTKLRRELARGCCEFAGSSPGQLSEV